MVLQAKLSELEGDARKLAAVMVREGDATRAEAVRKRVQGDITHAILLTKKSQVRPLLSLAILSRISQRNAVPAGVSLSQRRHASFLLSSRSSHLEAHIASIFSSSILHRRLKPVGMVFCFVFGDERVRGVQDILERADAVTSGVPPAESGGADKKKK